MRVGISLLTLVRGDQGGAETYARELLRSLGSAGTLGYTVFSVARAGDGDGEHEPVALRTPSSFASRGRARIPIVALAARTSRSVRHAVRGLDAVHYPLTVPVPKAGDTPSIVTLHDLQHHDLPALFSRSQRAFRSRAYDRAAERSAATIVPSEFVRERAIELLDVDPRHVHVVPHGVDHGLFAPGSEARESFLLYPARPWRHKNHPRLFQALVDLRRELPDLRLVLTGGGLERLRPLPDGVEPLGLVTREELASLYRRAACLVFPSLHEGFGLPVLEAMASGCPVAASTAGALPGVCGDAAVLFDPEDVRAMENGIREALARADELRAAGLARAEFTWEESAAAHEDVFRRVA